MIKQHVCDTNSIIWYFEKVFEQPSKLSRKAESVIDSAFENDSETRLVIPSIVFVEIYAKWYTTDELAAKIMYEVYLPIKNCDNIQIRAMSDEVLENLLKLKGTLINHDLHDKIILAYAMMLNCPLLTSDNAIIKYVTQYQIIPFII